MHQARRFLLCFTLFFLLFNLSPAPSFAQNKFTISGTIKDKRSGESLIGATIKLQEKISRILNLITSAKDKKWLEGRLKNAHEPSLEERLFQLFEILPFSFGKRELRAFSKSCAESRNAISHFGGQRSGDYSDFIHDLSIKSDALKFLYHSLILHYINVDDDILKSWLYDGYESYKNKRMLSAVHLLNLSS